MAAIGGSMMNLLDVAKQQDPSGKIATVAEVLTQTNELVQDIPMYESNAPTGNRVTLRSSLPSVAFTKINEGVVRSKASTEQITDSIGIMAGLSEVDSRMRLTAAGNFAKVRWNEDQAFLEAMAQAAAFNFLYGNEAVNQAAFTGLTPRFNSTTGKYGASITLGGGSGSDNTSIWIIDWSERYVHGIYPIGSAAGLDVRDRGEQRVTDAAGNPFMAYSTAYDWALGLTVRDHRHVHRICNIDVSDTLTAGEATDNSPKIVTKLMQAFGKMRPPSGSTRRIYCNQTVWTALSIMAVNKANLALGMREWDGMGLVPDFWGAPIRRVDQISNAETLVS